MESSNLQESGENCEERFHRIEKACVGYDDYVNAEEKNFLKTYDELEALVKQIQKENVFSSNEELREIQTEHMKLLMVPYYEADTLFRIMDQRTKRVDMAHTYYLEYLKLMKHYNLLEPEQAKKWKELYKMHFQRKNQQQSNAEDASGDQKQHPLVTLATDFEDRDTKIAQYKFKKAIESNLDRLKNYQDEAAKREFYKVQIQFSILKTFEQLRMTSVEMQILQHQATLTPSQHARNDARSAQREDLPPLQVTHIGPDDIEKLPYLVQPSGAPGYGGGGAGGQAPMMPPGQAQQVVQEYVDPMKAFQPVDRVEVQQDDVNDRMNLKTQYQKQVFQPGHILPTKSIEQLADEEMRDAIERQHKEQHSEYMAGQEDPDSEDIMERERKKVAGMDDWKDWNPKGSGNTKRI